MPLKASLRVKENLLQFFAEENVCRILLTREVMIGAVSQVSPTERYPQYPRYPSREGTLLSKCFANSQNRILMQL